MHEGPPIGGPSPSGRHSASPWGPVNAAPLSRWANRPETPAHRRARPVRIQGRIVPRPPRSAPASRAGRNMRGSRRTMDGRIPDHDGVADVELDGVRAEFREALREEIDAATRAASAAGITLLNG